MNLAIPFSNLQGLQRKIIHSLLYELISIVIISPLFSIIFQEKTGNAFLLSMLVSVIAILWNIIFNYLFEKVEQVFKITKRTFCIRVFHTLLFEFGQSIFLVPLFAYWLNISLFSAFCTDFTLLVFFLFYTFIFNWWFDQLFGLPQISR